MVNSSSPAPVGATPVPSPRRSAPVAPADTPDTPALGLCAELRETRAAVIAAVPALRHLTRAWADTAELEPVTAEALILAVDEAVTNAVEHGHRDRPGLVRLLLTRAQGGALTAVVADDGTWRPIPVDPGFRGRGLLLIDRLADHADISHSPHGTTVEMSWTPEPEVTTGSHARTRVGHSVGPPTSQDTRPSRA
jgi:anti-sigma regulatory factor (Ser/Thr protein kinase)